MPFEKGKSGNPNGGRKAKKAREALERHFLRDGEDMPQLMRIAAKLAARAEEGDVASIKEVFDRMDGKVPQAIVGDDDMDPVNVLARIERVIVKPTD